MHFSPLHVSTYTHKFSQFATGLTQVQLWSNLQSDSQIVQSTNAFIHEYMFRTVHLVLGMHFLHRLNTCKCRTNCSRIPRLLHQVFDNRCCRTLCHMWRMKQLSHCNSWCTGSGDMWGMGPRYELGDRCHKSIGCTLDRVGWMTRRGHSLPFHILRSVGACVLAMRLCCPVVEETEKMLETRLSLLQHADSD